MNVAMWVFFALFVAVSVVDVFSTMRAIGFGAVEANPVLRKLFGARPKMWQLLLAKGVIVAGVVVACCVVPSGAMVAILLIGSALTGWACAKNLRNAARHRG